MASLSFRKMTLKAVWKMKSREKRLMLGKMYLEE